jgi:ubiquitin-conjugating enzyme E2 variant
MWFLKLHCDKDYPTKPPTVIFESKVAMECVDARGNVIPARVPYLASWNATKSLHGTLTDVKNQLARAQRAQPPDGAKF